MEFLIHYSINDLTVKPCVCHRRNSNTYDHLKRPADSLKWSEEFTRYVHAILIRFFVNNKSMCNCRPRIMMTVVLRSHGWLFSQHALSSPHVKGRCNLSRGRFVF